MAPRSFRRVVQRFRPQGAKRRRFPTAARLDIREVFLLLKGGKRLQLAIEPALVDSVGDYVQQRVS